MLETPSPYGRLLADGDIWSELLSLLFVLLFFAIPAIIKALSESAKNKRPGQDKESAREKTYAQDSKARQRRQLQTEWDRRQQLIRERLEALKEKEQAFAAPKRAPAQPPPIKPPVKEILPMATPIYEEPSPLPPIPPKPVMQAQPRPYEEYAAARAAYTPPEKVSIQQEPAARKAKAAAARKQPVPKTHSVLERIIAQSNPLKAGIILKEILDKPKSLSRDSGF